MATFRVLVPFEVEAADAEDARDLVCDTLTERDAADRVMVAMGIWCLAGEMTVHRCDPVTSRDVGAVVAGIRAARTPEEKRVALDRFQELIARGWKYEPRHTRRAS